jgi:hypothetical protein
MRPPTDGAPIRIELKAVSLLLTTNGGSLVIRKSDRMAPVTIGGALILRSTSLGEDDLHGIVILGFNAAALNSKMPPKLKMHCNRAARE